MASTTIESDPELIADIAACRILKHSFEYVSVAVCTVKTMTVPWVWSQPSATSNPSWNWITSTTSDNSGWYSVDFTSSATNTDYLVVSPSTNDIYTPASWTSSSITSNTTAPFIISDSTGSYSYKERKNHRFVMCSRCGGFLPHVWGEKDPDEILGNNEVEYYEVTQTIYSINEEGYVLAGLSDMQKQGLRYYRSRRREPSEAPSLC